MYKRTLGNLFIASTVKEEAICRREWEQLWPSARNEFETMTAWSMQETKIQVQSVLYNVGQGFLIDNTFILHFIIMKEFHNNNVDEKLK